MRLEGNSDLGPGIGKLRRSCHTVVAIPTIGASFVVLLLLIVCLFVVLVYLLVTTGRGRAAPAGPFDN